MALTLLLSLLNRGGVRNFSLGGPKIQGVWAARPSPHRPEKLTGSVRLPHVPHVDAGGCGPMDTSPPAAAAPVAEPGPSKHRPTTVQRNTLKQTRFLALKVV